MFRKTFTLSLKKFSLLRIAILLGVFSIGHSLYGQSAISVIDTTHVTPTKSTVVQTSSDEAINELTPEDNYTHYFGERFDANVNFYTVNGRDYDNFLTPDTVALIRTDNKRFVNIWYEVLTDIDTDNDELFDHDTLAIASTKIEDADLIYQLKSVNAGYDNILVNDDDEGLNAIQAQTERVDVIWYSGIVTCEPDSAVFPVVERGGNDEILVAAITSLDSNGEPDGFSDLIAIEDSDWPQAGVSFNNYLILRRQTVGVEPLPLANIGTFIPNPLGQAVTFQPAQTVQGVAVSFTELGITSNQVVYGYSIFASDLVNDISANPLTLASGVNLIDISTYPTSTKASDSGLDLVAGVTAAVSADDCLTPATGPGGYKAALATWLKANETSDVTTSTEDGNVSDWQDHWTGNHDFATASDFPKYRSTSSTINFNQSVDFTTDPTSLSTDDNEDFNTASFYTNKGINIAFRTDELDTTSRQVIYEQGNQNRGISVYIRASNLHVSAWNQPTDDGSADGWNTGTITTVSDTIWANREYIVTLEFNGSASSTGTLTAYKNGRSIGSLSSVGLLYDHTDGATETAGIELGGSDGNIQYDDGTNSSTNSFDGEISEFIYCNEPTNFPLAQRNRIESYLAIKYGITLDQGSPNDYVNSNGDVIFDATNNASIGGYLEYNNDIAGIGRDDGSEFVQLKSKSENDEKSQSKTSNTVVTVERPTAFTSDNNFLLWGNDDGVKQDNETTDVPNVIERRVKRVWRAAETGETGNNNITFDLDEFTFDLGSIPDASDITLLVAGNSSGGVFTGAQIITGGTIDGNNDITFSGVNLENGQYFTLGTRFTGCGPGGIGPASNLALWLKADLGPNTTVDNADVTEWTDFAGTNNASEATNPPDYIENFINFNPALDFNGVNEIIEGSAGFHTNTYFFVANNDDVQTTGTNTEQAVLGFDQTAGATDQGGFWLGGRFGVGERIAHFVGIGTGGYQELSGLAGDIPADFTGLYEIRETAGLNDVTLTEKGSNITLSLFGSFARATNEEYALGNYISSTGRDNDFDGQIMEVISYSDRLTDTESQQVLSYLAIKYGITLDQTSATNYLNSSGTTIWDGTTNSSHNNDIAGIGRDDDSCLEQKQSLSSTGNDIVTIGLEDIATTNKENLNSFTADESFLIWGNDGGLTTYGNGLDGDDITDVTGIGTVTKRMTRIWRVDESGTVGNTEVAFNLNGLGYPSSNAADYQLIISPNSDLSSATTTNGGSFNGSVLTFDGVDFTDGDYFSLGIARSTCGPGGVTTDLALWLKANEGTGSTTNGAEINTWDDQSSNANNGSEDNLGGALPTNPTYSESDINFNPSVDFTSPGGTNGGFISTSSNSVSGDLSMIAVFRTGQTGGSTTNFEKAPTIIGAGENSDFADYGMGISEGRVHINAKNDSLLNARSASGTTYNDLEPHILTGTRIQAASGAIELYLNGENVASGTSSNTALSTPGFALGNVGQGPSAGADATENGQFNGSIAEAIVFSDDLSSDERQRIESYLAVKYGITRNATDDGGTPSVDERDYLASDAGVIWDISETSYNADIAGIGRDDDSCLNQAKSKSENDDAIVTMEFASFSADDSWLIWGNDNAALEDRSNTEFPASINSRLNREWYVQESGTVGTITLTFDLSLVNGPTGVGTNNLNQVRLLLDDDDLGTPNGDFTDNVNIIAPTSIDSENDIITFDIDLEDTEYFTLGSLEKYALPIELVDFSAEEVQGDVLLTWITASEENNAFYTIERSLDGLNYEALANMDGAGTFTGIQNYEYWDNKPQKGFNFYRIKQTDIDGTSSYSPVESVLIDEDSEMSLLVSPNPISLGESVNVSWNLSPTSEIHALYVLDIHGRVVFEQVLTNGQNRQEVPTRNFRKGLYLVRIRTKDYKSLTQKLIVE